MGNTIRRQPISSKIPASPNYRFLNITDFKGLDISDNPFILKPNTASDLLNVYVDENNALSTRPRLEKTHDFSWLIGDGELIGVYNITDGYLIHINVDGVYKMYKHPVDAENNEISGDIPTAKCSVFEKNDTVYLLDGNKYYALKDMNVGAVEPYIPTTRQASLENREGGSYEQQNILTDRYKESYFWDKFEMPFIDTENVVNVVNNTYTSKPLSLPSGYKVVAFSNLEILALDTNNSIFHGILTNDFTSVDLEYTGHSLPSGYENLVAAKNALSFFVLGHDDNQNVHYAFKNGVLNETQITNFATTLDYAKHVWCSSDGDCVFLSNEYEIDYYSIKMKTYGHANTNIAEVVCADIINGDLFYGTFTAGFGFVRDFYTNYKASWMPHESSVCFLTHIKTSAIDTFGLFENGLYVCDSKTGNGAYVELDEQDKVSKITYNNSSNVKHTTISKKGIIGVDYTKKDLVVSYIRENVFYNHAAGFTFEQLEDSNGTDRFVSFVYDEINDLFFVANGSASNSFFVCVNTKPKEPQLLIEKKLTNKELDAVRGVFLKSFLTTRFENNWWFASGNTLFRTENNDPTYIPLDEEFELGDTKDPVTGFNIAQDDLLLAYKKNNIYAIQPYEAYNRSTYSILETKNVSGNNATGSTIVTTLTEIPVHISYDGIFALKQLKNVQSSDRISELISDNINKRWLKESKSAIDTCQTINRLYWTYFVLKERDVTKVYLLDNRTQSWFYWELPITCINVFVKDETTIFVDENGMVYKLTTDDIINEYNKDVTEYYDNGKKLIKWFWKSQILPLGTINYSKKLVDTTFIVADTDDSDEYGLNYKFRAYRKLVSESNETTISNRLNYVQSTTKKTLIPRFNFLQLEISNVEDDLNNNKLRLLGLGLKYVLLEGLL